MKKYWFLIAILSLFFVSCSSSDSGESEDGEYEDEEYVVEDYDDEVVMCAVDSAEIERMMKFFRVSEGSIRSLPVEYYIPKDAPKYVNVNAVYPYILKSPFREDEDITLVRLQIQYTAEKYLYIKGVRFTVEGESYDFNADSFEQKSQEGSLWEISLTNLNGSHAELMRALCNAKQAKITLTGVSESSTRSLSEREIAAFRNTFDMYRALTGCDWFDN